MFHSKLLTMPLLKIDFIQNDFAQKERNHEETHYNHYNVVCKTHWEAGVKSLKTTYNLEGPSRKLGFRVGIINVDLHFILSCGGSDPQAPFIHTSLLI